MSPSQRTAFPYADAVVTWNLGAHLAPVRMFHKEPAWRKTSIGPIAVEENI
jgi:hypothetical protein